MPSPEKVVFATVLFTGLFWLPIVLGKAIMKNESEKKR